MLRKIACAAVLAAGVVAAPVEAAFPIKVDAVPADAKGAYYNDNWIWSNELLDIYEGVWTLNVRWITRGQQQQKMVVGAAWSAPTDPNIEAYETADNWGDSTMVRDNGYEKITFWEDAYEPWIQDYDETGYLSRFTFDTEEPLYAYAYFPSEIGGIPFADAPSVPEPATWALLIAGFGIVGVALRDCRRRAAGRTAAPGLTGASAA